MNEHNPWSGIHQPREPKPVVDMPADETMPLPTDNESVLPEQTVVEEESDEAKESSVLKALSGLIERQTDMINSLVDTVQNLSEQVLALTQQVGVAKDERSEIKQVAIEIRAALAQYVRTNALPHDVIKLLQTENENMIRKLEIRPQTDILRAVRDLYLEMNKNKKRFEESGDTTAIKLLDLLMITLQEDILEEYGVEVLTSAEGIPFKASRMTNDGNVPTECKEKHMHVAKSLAAGFQFEKEVLLKERVVLYNYDPVLEADYIAIEDQAAEEATSSNVVVSNESKTTNETESNGTDEA